MSVLLTYVYLKTMCLPGSHGYQERVLDPLELEWKVIASQCVGTPNWTQIFCKSNKFSQLLKDLQV